MNSPCRQDCFVPDIKWPTMVVESRPGRQQSIESQVLRRLVSLWPPLALLMKGIGSWCFCTNGSPLMGGANDLKLRERD